MSHYHSRLVFKILIRQKMNLILLGRLGFLNVKKSLQMSRHCKLAVPSRSPATVSLSSNRFRGLDSGWVFEGKTSRLHEREFKAKFSLAAKRHELTIAGIVKKVDVHSNQKAKRNKLEAGGRNRFS